MRRLLVDLTDVAIFAHGARHVTGIQRVQLQVARALLKRENTVAFAVIDGSARDISALFRNGDMDSEKLFARLARLGRRRRSPFDLEAFIRSIVRPVPILGRSRDKAPDLSALSPNAGDVMYVGGAFWVSRDSIPLYEFVANFGMSLVTFIHDVIPLTYPKFTGGGAVPLFYRLLRLPLHVLTPSDFSRQDVLRACRQMRIRPPLSMRVTPLAHEYPGATRSQPEPKPSSRLRQMIGDRAFILTVGTVEIRKNHSLLLKAWRNLANTGATIPPLVVAGAAGWMASSVIKSLRAAKAGALYIFVESPTDEELKWLYHRCQFTVFASKVEGWGLPVGESLWFGKPCVALHATSLPEVGGDLCEYAEDDTPEAMAKAVLRLCNDDQYRHERTKAILKANLRTWNHASEEIADYVDLLRR